MDLHTLKTTYEKDFVPTPEYLESLPDIQNSSYTLSKRINQVGISGIKIPLRVRMRDGGTQQVTATISGTVSLEAHKRGINMSRILRTLYKNSNDVFDVNMIGKVLQDYKRDLDCFDSFLIFQFGYYLWVPSLRSKKEDGSPEGGYQFYDVTFDCELNAQGEFKKEMTVRYVYSSACPCSTELSMHAAETRGVFGIPHSQRSYADIIVGFEDFVWIEDVIEMARKAIPTEVLVFCKRVDEQAFAELNGSQPKFVEDAVRLLAEEIEKNKSITNYTVRCTHEESLHGHDAIAVIFKNNIGNE